MKLKFTHSLAAPKSGSNSGDPTTRRSQTRVRFILLLLFLTTLWIPIPRAHGQNANPTNRCSSAEVLDRQLKQFPEFAANRKQLEAFTQRYVADAVARGDAALRSGILRIPVVVHVVYNTPTENISDPQIFSQIDILNADFRALNADIGTVPVVFQPLIGDVRIQFVLAVRDPNCNPTTGITRTPTSVTSFSDNDAVKSTASGGHDAWPRDKYLNIWVCDLGGGLLGYAQFPGGPAATDGVVVNHTAFGNIGTATAPYNLGRTATHEIGHWLNLSHIFGSCSCTDDGVSDTPIQSCYNFNCPTFPHISCANGPNGDLFMNYMDYVDDACMTMFSQGQVTVVEACLQAPAPAGRAELLGSDGLIPATGLPVTADLWSQDTPSDPGTEPNITSTYMWGSDDIWCRVSNDGIAHQDHENPIFHPISGAANYVYVRVRNRSCSSSGSGTVKLYWAKASSALSWPAPWDGSISSPCPTPASMGGFIASQSTGSIPPGGYVILEFPWAPPSPASYSCFGADQSHFCLLSRIETSSVSPYGMTTPETSDLNANVANNNNIVWKNVHVNTGSDRIGWTTIGNLRPNRATMRLVYDVPPREQSAFKFGGVYVHLGEKLFQRWQEGGSVGFNIQNLSNGVIRLLNPGAVIGGLQLDPGDLYTVGLEFARSPNTRGGNYILPLTLTQQEFRRDAYFPVGGNTFVLKERIVPGVLTPLFDAAGTTLTWTAFGTGRYLVQSTDDLNGQWKTIGVTTETRWRLQVDPAARQQFYRIYSPIQ